MTHKRNTIVIVHDINTMTVEVTPTLYVCLLFQNANIAIVRTYEVSMYGPENLYEYTRCRGMALTTCTLTDC